MNICFLYGKIVSEIKFDFLYNHKHHISIIEFDLEIKDGQDASEKNILKVYGLDEIADSIYAQYEKGDWISIIGTLENVKIRIKENC